MYAILIIILKKLDTNELEQDKTSTHHYILENIIFLNIGIQNIYKSVDSREEILQGSTL